MKQVLIFEKFASTSPLLSGHWLVSRTEAASTLDFARVRIKRTSVVDADFPILYSAVSNYSPRKMLTFAELDILPAICFLNVACSSRVVTVVPPQTGYLAHYLASNVT